MSFTVVSWNVAGRVGERQLRQAEVLLERDFDVICLQEITPRNRAAWIQALERGGYRALASRSSPEPGASRRLCVLIASRGPLERRAAPALPWQERHLTVETRIAGREVEVHTIHAPLSSKPDLAKVRTLEALYRALAAPGDLPTILAGDLNTPQYESRHGEIQTFARTRSGALRSQYGARHDRAELALLQALPQLGWLDAFRCLHGYERRDRSWKVGRHPGYRLDHILASPGLSVIACDYVHGVREDGLSDHSAIWAELSTD